MFGLTLIAAEIDLETGEVLGEWRPDDVPLVEECGAPAFGFPVDRARPDSAWAFLGCDGYVAFTQGPGGTKVIRAPAYVDEKPSSRDVASRREDFEEFRRRVEELQGRPYAAGNVDEWTEEYAGRPKFYYLLRGQETLDARGRLWIFNVPWP